MSHGTDDPEGILMDDDFIPKAKLVELLAVIPPDALLWLNGAGGISILDADGHYMGHIAQHFTPTGSEFVVAWRADETGESRVFA